jgi:hypothetical protein
MEHLGARFGLLVFDECHHLPGASYGFAARLSLAPFRLGLTATPERGDGREADLGELIGPTVYRKDIVDLSGDYLTEYDTERVAIDLSPAERAEYDAERAIYRAFVEENGIRMSSPSGWSEFIMRSSRGLKGRRAMQAYRRQRELAFCAPAPRADRKVRRQRARHCAGERGGAHRLAAVLCAHHERGPYAVSSHNGTDPPRGTRSECRQPHSLRACWSASARLQQPTSGSSEWARSPPCLPTETREPLADMGSRGTRPRSRILPFNKVDGSIRNQGECGVDPLP